MITGALLEFTTLSVFESRSTFGAVILVFGLLLVAACWMAFVIWILRLVMRRDKRFVTRWLAPRARQIQEVQWVIYPTRRFWLQRCSTFEVRFTDNAGVRHHAFIAVPTWSAPAFLEDNEVPA